LEKIEVMSRSCTECAVRESSLCGGLSDEELGALNTLGRRRRVARGETLIWAGDASIICANLLSGVLKLGTSTADGREQIVGLLFPADLIGRPFAQEVDFTVTALTDAELCVFPRKPFEQVLEDHVQMEHMLLQRTLRALDAARARMLTLGRRTAGEKVAAFLLDMATRIAGPCHGARADLPMTFDLPLSRGQVADLLGLTIETVSRQLTKLKIAGIIALPATRAVTILDRRALEAHAEIDLS
jgi:CRP/FNR family transcriptional regulator